MRSVHLRPVERAVYWGCRAGDAVRRARTQIEALIGGLGTSLLSAESLGRVTARLYDWHPYNRRAEIFEWEVRWWEQCLPRAPASILVGGCGRGREVEGLTAHGYCVSAFDPSLDSVRECQARNPTADYVGWFSYEQLIDAQSAHPSRHLLPADRYDAILLGWGSLSHVLDESTQERLFRLLDSLAPRGPILASVVSVTPHQPRRIERVAHRCGRALRQLTPSRTARAAGPNVRCLAHAGFIYCFTPQRLQELAEVCGRRLELRDGGARATFWPRDGA